MSRNVLAFLAWAGLLVPGLKGGISFEVSIPVGLTPGDPLYRYTYHLSGFTFAVGDEVNLQFDPVLFGELTNAVAGIGFDVVLFQTNDPPGVQGDYSAMALIDNPSLAGPFGVDVVFNGPGLPGTQRYFINRYHSDGSFTTLSSGWTSPAADTAVPEPPGTLPAALVLLVGSIGWAVRRHHRGRAV